MIDKDYVEAISILKLLSIFYIKCNRFINFSCDLNFYSDEFEESIKIEKSSSKEIYWVLFSFYENGKKRFFLGINFEEDIITIYNPITKERSKFQIQSLSEIKDINSTQFVLEYGRLPDYFLSMRNKENLIKLLKDKLGV